MTKTTDQQVLRIQILPMCTLGHIQHDGTVMEIVSLSYVLKKEINQTVCSLKLCIPGIDKLSFAY